MQCKYFLPLYFLITFSAVSLNGSAQTIDSSLLNQTWDADWIVVPQSNVKGYGVFVFRKEFTLPAQPHSFVVHVSADNRYKLFVNGALVSLGPARGDFFHWNYETTDIASHLRSGENVVAALVWNEGEVRPEAQITHQTSFLLQGNSSAEKIINTNKTWKCAEDSSYRPLAVHVRGYYAAGAAELVDMNKHLHGWEQARFSDAGWKNAERYSPGLPKGVFSFDYSWMLQPSPIPAMEMKLERVKEVRQASGITVPKNFPGNDAPVTVPPNSHITLLFDQGYLTNAYPTLLFGGGKNAGISLSYAEALYGPGNYKGNRDSVAGKEFVGKKDSIVSNGREGQNFTSLWWRTYRYIQLKVDTKDEPLTINDLYGTFTGYPFVMKAKFAGGDNALQKIMDIGWRTARLCANETYMDCPYYEQLQYIGDARIQALVSLYNSGDDRLMRNALNQMDELRIAEGITLSRYPTAHPQEIPFFSTWYIGMLHDYWMYRPDSNFIRDKLAGVRQILNFFSHYQQADQSLHHVPYWTFTDWVSGYGWQNGIPPIGSDGSSAVFDLQLLWAYQLAAQMEYRLGMKAFGDNYSKAANLLGPAIRAKYWDETKMLFADTREKKKFSQHANALAILTGVISGKAATTLAASILADTTLAPASVYFKYYLHLAGVKGRTGRSIFAMVGQVVREH